MGRLEDYPHTDLHLLTLDLVEKHADPVVWAGDLMDDPAMTASKPTVLEKLRDLEEWGLLHREEMGQTFVYWPAEHGIEHLQDKIDALEKENSKLVGRVETLDEELQTTKTQLGEAREELSAVRSDGPTPLSSKYRFVPETTDFNAPDEQRWRLRGGEYRRLFFTSTAYFAFAFGVFAVVFLQLDTIQNLGAPWHDAILAGTTLFVLGTAAFVAITALSYGLVVVALNSPALGESLDKIVTRIETREWDEVATTSEPELED